VYTKLREKINKQGLELPARKGEIRPWLSKLFTPRRGSRSKLDIEGSVKLIINFFFFNYRRLVFRGPCSHASQRSAGSAEVGPEGRRQRLGDFGLSRTWLCLSFVFHLLGKLPLQLRLWIG
jgi:hypothetical protein